MGRASCVKASNKVIGLGMVTFKIWTTIFEWGVVKCESWNGRKKDTCLKEIGLRAQKFLPIPCSSVIYTTLVVVVPVV